MSSLLGSCIDLASKYKAYSFKHTSSKTIFNLFLDELSRLPPKQEIDFIIEMQPKGYPISIPPYQMALGELKTPETQLRDMLAKGFIHPGISPWGAPILFLKNKDDDL